MKVFTTINPYGNLEAQNEALLSWSKHYEVYSINLKEEIELAKDKYPYLKFLETDDFYLVNIYFPNSNSELGRLAYRLEFNNELLKYFEKLAKKKPLIITGDYNVAHQEIDLARPKDNEGSAGFTPEERAWMTKFLEAGFIDTFRELNGEKIQYSWWSFRAGARERNVGWRIDYFCTSAKLRKHLKKAYILDKIMGSDHAPVGLEINL